MTPAAEVQHNYPGPPIRPHPACFHYHISAWNKCGSNLKSEWLPDIGKRSDLWPELLSVRLDLEPYLTQAQRDRIDQFVAQLTRPVVLLHTQGEKHPTWRRTFDQNGLSDTQVQRGLADLGATVVLLDHGGPAERLDTPRVVSLRERLGPTTVPELALLIGRADLYLGIDSGPQHLTRLTDTPAVAVWWDTHPAASAIPRPQTHHLTDRRWAGLNAAPAVKENYRVTEVPRIDAAAVVRAAAEMLRRAAR